MMQAKKAEISSIVEKEVDVSCILEANVTRDQMKYYEFTNYIFHILTKARQIASGIMIGIIKDLKHKFVKVKDMTENDKSEIVKVRV